MGSLPKFCEPVIQCPNERFKGVPILVWPKVKNEKYQRVHWVHEAPKSLFPKHPFDKIKSMKKDEINRLAEEHPDELLGNDYFEKLTDFLKQKLNWKAPKIRALEHSFGKGADDRKHFGSMVICFVSYDGESEAKTNTMINNLMNFNDEFLPVIKGPCIFFDENQMLDQECSLNIANLFIINSFGALQRSEKLKRRAARSDISKVGSALAQGGMQMFETFKYIAGREEEIKAEWQALRINTCEKMHQEKACKLCVTPENKNRSAFYGIISDEDRFERAKNLLQVVMQSGKDAIHTVLDEDLLHIKTAIHKQHEGNREKKTYRDFYNKLITIKFRAHHTGDDKIDGPWIKKFILQEPLRFGNLAMRTELEF